VMFFTDGFIGNEREVIALTQRELGDARIFGFGVGASVNRYLLDEVSLAGRGFAEYLLPGEEASALVERFYQRIGKPYLTDLEIDWGALTVHETFPRRLPDLSAFEPLVVFGRFEQGAHGKITLRGKLGGRPFAQSMAIDLAPARHDNPAIAPLWAREKIAELGRLEHQGGSQERAVTRVALEHRLITPYTSFVAIDLQSTGAGGPGLSIAQPSEAPAGVDRDAAGGVVVTLQGAPRGEPLPESRADEAPLPTNASAPASMVLERRGGGCAGCATAGRPSPNAAALGAIVIALALLARRFLDGRRGKGP
jgi:Ca-activated chloride channel homolog